MKKFHSDRLLALADFLLELPRRKFNFCYWVDVDTWRGSKKLNCGTTACALGWATTMPRFRRLGLYMARTGTPALRRDPGLTALEVAQVIFGISFTEAAYICTPSTDGQNFDATPKSVAKHIRKFVARKLSE